MSGQIEETLRKIDLELWTEHCTINNQNNTEYEKGEIHGLIKAARIVRKHLNTY